MFPALCKALQGQRLRKDSVPSLLEPKGSLRWEWRGNEGGLQTQALCKTPQLGAKKGPLLLSLAG